MIQTRILATISLQTNGCQKRHPRSSSWRMNHRTLSEELRFVLEMEGEALTVAQLTERVGDRGFGLLLLVLSLPSALPVPAAGYSIPFGILLLVLSLQMLIGKHHPVFPKRMQRVSISKRMAERLLSGAAWIFRKLEWIIRPRMRWVGRPAGQALMGVLVLIMAVLMMIPIPMTNTIPAFVIFLIGIGLTEDDGLFCIGACLVGIIAVILYAALVWAMIVYGPEIVVTIKEYLKELI